MDWLKLVAVTVACVAAVPVATAHASVTCRLDPPLNGSCSAQATASEGAACRCPVDGVASPGRVVIFGPGPARGSLTQNAPGSDSRRRSSHISPASPSVASVARTSSPHVLPLEPARALRLASQIPDAGVGAYGVVALTATATPATLNRLTSLCRAFLASLPAQSSLPATVALADQMLTYWPVHALVAEECGTMLDSYDLWTGQKAILDAMRQGNDLNGRGPFLIGWSPTESRAMADAVVLVVDLSNLESEASFTDVFRFWRERIVQDPSIWRDGFRIELMRLAMRDFADQHGSDILKAFHLIKE